MAAIPFMPLYVADYLADAAHLSTVEHGAYLLLIMTYWQRGEALPDDDRKLARITRMEPRSWLRIKPAISEFFEVSDGKYLHSRIEKELASVRAKSLKNRKGGLARAKQMHSGRLADAQPYTTDTDAESSVAKATGAEAPDKVFWDTAKAYLANGGVRNPGSLIGKWSRDYGKPETARALSEAQVERAVEPIAYVERILRKRQPTSAGEIW